jgi:hypothetical protein
MHEYYFSKLPIFEYKNTQCRDLTRRMGLSNQIADTPTNFYPYEVSAGLRSDVLASAYYNDSYLDWLIYLTNGIIDPYSGWHLSENDFEELLKKKYGSIEESQRRTRHYALNWSDDDIAISVSFFENTLPEALKKYYSPNFGVSGKVISYRRRREDWVVNTNKILSTEITLNSDTEFANNELVDFKIDGEVVGGGEIVVVNTSLLVTKNITGNTSANTATIIGLTTNATANLVETTILDTTIPDEEFIFWTPVTYFDYEREKNEANKQIYLLDANRALQVAEELRRGMKT